MMYKSIGPTLAIGYPVKFKLIQWGSVLASELPSKPTRANRPGLQLGRTADQLD